MTFQLLWPERRCVTAAQIRSWHDDAVDNREVDPLDRNATDLDRARALDDAGLITLQSPTKGAE